MRYSDSGQSEFLATSYSFICVDCALIALQTLDRFWSARCIPTPESPRIMSLLSKRIQLGLLSGCFCLLAAEAASAGSFVARFTRAGTLDTSFNGTGYAAEFVATDAVDVHVDGKQRIVSCGQFGPAGVIFRYKGDGRPDTGFGSQGVAAINYPVRLGVGGCAIAPGNKIVAVATADPEPERWIVARFNEDGSPDQSFGQVGWVETVFSNAQHAAAHHVHVLGDGSIIVTGDINWHLATARYRADGSADRGYGWLGIAHFSSGLFPFGAFVDGWGQVMAAGDGSTSGTMMFTRLTPLGQPDRYFSGDGTAEYAFPNYQSAARSVTMDWDRRYVIVGGVWQEDVVWKGFGIVRTLGDGTRDGSFSGDGREITLLQDGQARDVAVETTGKIVVAGYATEDGERKAVVARYFDDGSLDRSFSGDGVSLTRIGNASMSLALAVALDDQDRAIVVGRVTQ
jgi:uncharacterized delta-60 repeat protein